MCCSKVLWRLNLHATSDEYIKDEKYNLHGSTGLASIATRLVSFLLVTGTRRGVTEGLLAIRTFMRLLASASTNETQFYTKESTIFNILCIQMG